jgi:hypothetical protein
MDQRNDECTMDQKDDERIAKWRIEYEQICENDRSITEFRAKLLTLLPLASGTGISLLLAQGNGPLN